MCYQYITNCEYIVSWFSTIHKSFHPLIWKQWLKYHIDKPYLILIPKSKRKLCHFIFMGKISNLSRFLIIMSFSYKRYLFHSTHNPLSAHISLMYREIYYSKDHNIMSSMFYRFIFAFNNLYNVDVSKYRLKEVETFYSSRRHLLPNFRTIFSSSALSWHVIFISFQRFIQFLILVKFIIPIILSQDRTIKKNQDFVENGNRANRWYYWNKIWFI